MKGIRRTRAALLLPEKVPEFIERVDFILDKMRGDALFQGAAAQIAAAQALNDTLKTMQISAKNRTSGAATARDDQQKLVKYAVQGLLLVVQQSADADPDHAAAIITGAGMSVVPFTPRTILPFVVTQGDVSGEVVARVQSHGRGCTYWFASSTDQKTWAVGAPTRVAHDTFSGLTPATTYWFRYQVLTPKGMTDWSQPISLIVR